MAPPPVGTYVFASNDVRDGMGGLLTGWEVQGVAAGVGLSLGDQLYGSNVTNSVVFASPGISSIALGNYSSGNTIYASSAAGNFTFSGSHNTLHLSTGIANIYGADLTAVTTSGNASSSGDTIEGFSVSRDIYYPGMSLVGGLILLDASHGQTFNGSSLTFGTTYVTATTPTYLLELGSVGGGTAAEVAAAVNKVYTLAGSTSEHLLIIGQVTANSGVASAGDTVIYDFFQNATSSHTYVNPDLNGNHQIDANELFLEATLVGVTTSTLTLHSLGS